jgi:hemerythrin-like domain-containing protein
MTEVIKALQKEHSNITQLLNILDRQLSIFDIGGIPDYDILEAIADYFQSFPDLYHHPKEDLIFQRMKRRDAAAAARVGDLQREHEELAARTRGFAQAVRAVVEDVNVERRSFEHWARSFVEFQREHMRKEERLFFPSVLRVLTEADWAEIRARITDQEDPLLGETIGERYETLRQEILRWEREARLPGSG